MSPTKHWVNADHHFAYGALTQDIVYVDLVSLYPAGKMMEDFLPKSFDDIAKIIGIIGGLIVFGKGVWELMLRNRLSRYENYIKLENRFQTDENLTKIFIPILNQESNLERFDNYERGSVLSFFEDVAVMMNSGLIRIEIVHNAWGDALLKCWDNKSFWKGIDRESKYFPVLRAFHADIRNYENDAKVKLTASRGARYRF